MTTKLFFRARNIHWLYIVEALTIFLNFQLGHEVIVLPYLPLGSGIHKIDFSVFFAIVPVLALGVTAQWEFLSIETLSAKFGILKLTLAIQIIQGFLVFGILALVWPTFGNRFFASYCLMFSVLLLALLFRHKTTFWIYPLVAIMVATNIPARIYKSLDLNFFIDIFTSRGNSDFPIVLATSGLLVWFLVINRRPATLV